MGNSLKIIKTSDIKDAPLIHNVLFEAFSPYSEQYTEAAMNATIVSAKDLEERIGSRDFDVLIARCNNKIAGTASVKPEPERNLYLCSMAVKRGYYGKGIGCRILEEVEKIARAKGCLTVSLETSAPLVNAISLYEKFGFVRTGNQRDYYGVTIFEMIKRLQ